MAERRDDLGHTGCYRLSCGANSAVMYDRRRVRQQPAEGHKFELNDAVRQIGMGTAAGLRVTKMARRPSLAAAAAEAAK